MHAVVIDGYGTLDADDNIMRVACDLLELPPEAIIITPAGLEARPARDFDLTAAQNAEVSPEDYDDLPLMYYSIRACDEDEE